MPGLPPQHRREHAVATPACGCLTRGYVGYPFPVFVALRRFYRLTICPVSQGCLFTGFTYLHPRGTPPPMLCHSQGILRVYPQGVLLYPCSQPVAPGGAITRVYPQGVLPPMGYRLPPAYAVKPPLCLLHKNTDIHSMPLKNNHNLLKSFSFI